jgi:predicted MPP superfamily phosphohydrolase
MVILASLAMVAIWGIFIERAIYVVRKESIRVLPSGSNPITVLQIGDIHMAPWQKSKQRFIQSLTKYPIDLVVNTGDNLGHPKAISSLLQALGPLLSKPGVFVNGSNDYFGPVMKNPLGYIFHTSHAPNSARLDTATMTNAFEQAGWVNLNNKTSQLVVSGNKIRFIGLDDFHIGYSDSSKLSESRDFTIALTHAPYLEAIETLTKLGAELIFAGHTHGGQVRVPFLGALTTNSDLPNKYARGLSGWSFQTKSSILSVVAGLGNSIFAPVRFACFPEVRLITLLERD